jgi:hypothetical protein
LVSICHIIQRFIPGCSHLHAYHHENFRTLIIIVIILFVTSSALLCLQLEKGHTHFINIYAKFLVKYKVCHFYNYNKLKVNGSVTFTVKWHFMRRYVQFWINPDLFLQSVTIFGHVEHIFCYFIIKIRHGLWRFSRWFFL